MPVPSQRWSARSIVPSPPSTTTMSGSCSSTISTPQRAATARSRSSASPMTSAPAVGQEGRARHRHAVTTRRAHVRSGLRHRRSGPPAQGMRVRREVHDVLAISGRARDTRIAHAEDGPAGRGRKLGEILQHPAAHLRSRTTPRRTSARPASNCGFTSTSARHGSARARQHGREHEPERDERHVGRDESRAETAAPRSRAIARSSRRSR